MKKGTNKKKIWELGRNKKSIILLDILTLSRCFIYYIQRRCSTNKLSVLQVLQWQGFWKLFLLQKL